MVDTGQLEQKARDSFRIFSEGNTDEFSQYLADDFTYRSTSGEEAHGPDGFIQFYRTYDEAFSNMSVTVEEVFPTGNNKVAVLYRQRGTHSGNLYGLEPSNNDMNVLGCNIITFDDNGKMVDAYDIIDTLEVLKQLDALPGEVTEQLTLGGRPGA